MFCFKKNIDFSFTLLTVLIILFFVIDFSSNVLKAEEIIEENINEVIENYEFVSDISNTNLNIKEKIIISNNVKEEYNNIDNVYFEKINDKNSIVNNNQLSSTEKIDKINIDKIYQNNIPVSAEILEKKEINFKDYCNSENTITLSKEDYKVQWGYSKCKQSRKEVLGKEILYRDIFNGIDLIYKVDDKNNLKENIILKQPNTIVTFNLQYVLNNLIPMQVNKKK